MVNTSCEHINSFIAVLLVEDRGVGLFLENVEISCLPGILARYIETFLANLKVNEESKYMCSNVYIKTAKCLFIYSTVGQ